MLTTVDEHNRNLVAESPPQPFISGHVDFVPAHAELSADPGDDWPGVIAEMTARFGEQANPRWRNGSLVHAASLAEMSATYRNTHFL